MIDFAHEEMLFFLALLAFGDVVNGAAEAHGPSLRAGSFKICERISLHRTDGTISPPHPEFMVNVRLRIGGIERRLASRPKPFHVVRMNPLHEVLDRYLITGHVENFFKARVPRAHVAEQIVLPPPKPGCVESEL